MQQQPLPFLRTLPESEPSESQWERLYRYFVEAEETQSVVTSVKIQQIWLAATGELRDLNAVRWYMYRYWRWFLFLEDNQVKPYRYSCRNIKSYPLDYFVQAHIDTSRMQYLVHFVRSIETDKELRKLAVGRGPKRPRSFPIQQSLEADDQPQIQVDDHLAEEEEGAIPDIDFLSEEQRESSFPVITNTPVEEASEDAELSSPDTQETQEEALSGLSSSDSHDTSVQNEPGGDSEVESPLSNLPPVETPDPPRSDSSPFWSKMKDAATHHKVSLVVGVVLVICAVVVYFFFVKHSR